jgi:hypothetical protein
VVRGDEGPCHGWRNVLRTKIEGRFNLAYDIVFVEKAELGRAVGESIFLSKLPTNPKVFVFFYSGSDNTSEVETGLRTLGRRTGNNLFVNIGSQGRPRL